MFQSKIQNAFKKISQNPELMNKFKNSRTIEDITEICEEIYPSVTQKEIENEMIRLSQISDEKLEKISGGKMNFNRMKHIALATLLPIAMATNTIGTVHAGNTQSSTASKKTAAEEEREEEIALKLYIFTQDSSFYSGPTSRAISPFPLPKVTSGDDYLIKIYRDRRYEVSFGGKRHWDETTLKWISPPTAIKRATVLRSTTMDEIHALTINIPDRPTTTGRPGVLGAPEVVFWNIILAVNGNVYEYCEFDCKLDVDWDWHRMGWENDMSSNMERLIKKVIGLSPLEIDTFSRR